jgi:hypothetical protein
MTRLQRWESGPYFTDFSVHTPELRRFAQMREIVTMYPCFRIVSIELVFRYRTPKSDRLLGRTGCGLLIQPYAALNNLVHSRCTVLKCR